MSKYKKKNTLATPEISTASLPDIVFMLLFFFMTVTVIKNNEINVENELPKATEAKSIEKKDRIIDIYIGKKINGINEFIVERSQIQIDGKFVDIVNVGSYVLSEINKKPDYLRPFVTVALKVDKKAKMGVVSDVKEELRKINALKINYSTIVGDPFKKINSSQPKANSQ